MLWSCRGNVDGVGVGRGGAFDDGGVGVVAGVGVPVVVGVGNALRIAAAFCFLRWSRRRLDGLPVVEVYVGTVVLESGGGTLGSAVVCEDTLGSAGGYDWLEVEDIGSGGKPGGGGIVVAAAGSDGTSGAVGSEFVAVGVAAVLNRVAN